MKPDQVILEGMLRSTRGTQAAKKIREAGLIPGIVYGEGVSPVSIEVGVKELRQALQTKAGENALINLRLKDSAKKSQEMAVLIKELQLHPVSHHVVHVDFHRVSLTKRITVTVPLAFKGEPEGVRMEGGLLEHLRWDLEVECLPTEIPSEISMDVSALKVGQTLFAKEVSLPSGVRLVTDGELPVASCVVPKEEVAAPAAVEETAAAEPEVLKQKKPEEIAAEEAAKGQKQEKAKEPEKEKGEKSATGRGGSAK